jgi:hypothetical protein
VGTKLSGGEIGESRDGYFLAGTELTVRVDRIFKGSPPRTLTLFSENSSGRLPLADGTLYLLFVYQDHGRFVVDNCGNSSPLSKWETLRLCPRHPQKRDKCEIPIKATLSLIFLIFQFR